MTLNFFSLPLKIIFFQDKSHSCNHVTRPEKLKTTDGFTGLKLLLQMGRLIWKQGE